MKKTEPQASVAPARRTSATRSTDLASQLRAAIMKGELVPGAQLRLDQLREKFGVSLSPVREALLKLAGEGYVVSSDQRGFRVTPVSRENLEEITELRALLEPLALERSMQKGGEEWEDQVVARFHQLNRIEQTDDYGIERWETAHRRFHKALIEHCGMPILLEQCEMLHNLSDRYRRIFLLRNPHDRNVPEEHRAIFETAIARDMTKSPALLSEHISRTGLALAAYLSGKGIAEGASA